jgi:Secretion system C-terminal sorting domain
VDHDEFVWLGYHMNWPGAGDDMYYLRNTIDNSARRGYYSVNAIPRFYTDGTQSGVPTANQIHSMSSQEVPYQINVTPEFADGTIDVSVELITDVAIDGYRLHTALCLEHVDGPFPGSGPDEFEMVMLEMLPSANGQVIDVVAGTHTFEYSFEFDNDWSVPNLTVVCFLQNNTDKSVKQAGSAEVPALSPYLYYDNFEMNDLGQSDPNLRLDPGEEASLIVHVRNQEGFLNAEDVTGTLRCEDENVTISTESVDFGDIMNGFISANTLDPFTVSIADDYIASEVTFFVDLVELSGYEKTLEFTTLVGRPDVLLVNDFGAGTDVSSYWQDMFENAGLLYALNSSAQASATSSINNYNSVIWSTSNATGDVISDTEVTVISDYLTSGGKMLLVGEDIVTDEGENQWFQDFFACSGSTEPVTGVQAQVNVLGITDSPFDGIEAWIVNGSPNTGSVKALTPLEGSTSMMHYATTDLISVVGYRTDNFSSMHTGFNIEAVHPEGMADTDLTSSELMQLMLNWLNGITTSVDPLAHSDLPESIELNAYPNPFNGIVSLRYYINQQSNVSLEIFDTLGRSVATLVNENHSTGFRTVSWNADHMSSGVYFVRLTSGTDHRMHKIMLLK